MRPIDADALIEKCGGWYVEEGTESGFIGTLKNLLATMPTIQTVATDTNVGDTISRQQAIDALDCINGTEEVLRSLPSAQPEYEPVTAVDFAKTMSKNTLYNFMAWHNVAFTLMNEMGFVICKKTM